MKEREEEGGSRMDGRRNEEGEKEMKEEEEMEKEMEEEEGGERKR